MTATGERLWEGRFPRSDVGVAALTARCTPRSALAVEASTPTWHFADQVVNLVGELCIVDPLKTRLKAGYAAKTDRLEARRLADALRRDSVVGIYDPPLAMRERRELCRSRQALVQVRTALINRLRAVLLRQGSPTPAAWPRPVMTPGSSAWRCRRGPRRASRRSARS